MPTKADLQVKPTTASDEPNAGRFFWQYISDEQRLPENDHRYRVNPSEKFYVLQLMGSWVHVSEGAERSVKYRNRLKWVRFENKEYQLRSADKFKPFLGRFLQGGCYTYVGGLQIDSEKELSKIIPQSFIYIASTGAHRKFTEISNKVWDRD